MILARELRSLQTQKELAVLVVTEFTGELRKRKQLTASARLARTAAAAVAREKGLTNHAASSLDFDATRAVLAKVYLLSGYILYEIEWRMRLNELMMKPMNHHRQYAVARIRKRRCRDVLRHCCS